VIDQFPQEQQQHVPLVSVLMPIANDLETIVHAIGSVLDQDFPREDLELIIVNRGSFDGSRNVAMQSTYDRRVRLIDQLESSYDAALVLALQQARGSIVVVLDGETVLPMRGLAACVEALQHHEADIAVAPAYYRGSDPWSQAGALATSYLIGTQAIAFRRIVLEEAVEGQRFLPSRILGGKSVALPEDIILTRVAPPSARQLCAFHFERGRVAAESLRRSARSASSQDIIAGTVLLMSVSTLFSLAIHKLRPLATRSWGWYLLFVLIFSLDAINSPITKHKAAMRTINALRPDQLLPYMPVVFTLIYLSYGAGLLIGLAKK
jgi:glycosyltransferase involved in cell wall biosynthesis